MNGKPGTAPCGHAGEHVTANYVRCLRAGCDGTPREADVVPPIPASSRCPACTSSLVAPFPTMFYLGGGGRHDSWHCWDCGTVFRREDP